MHAELAKLMISNVPGFTVRTHSFRQLSWKSAPYGDASARAKKRFSLGDWFQAELDTRCSLEVAFYENADVRVFLDGYISDIVGENLEGGVVRASKVAELYVQHDKKFLPRLRGSYTCVIVDNRHNEVLLFNDRLGSRPLFYRVGAGWAFAPEVKRLAEFDPPISELDECAAVEFIVFGSFFDDRTVFSGIRKLPQASLVTFSGKGVSISSYWTLTYYGNQSVHDENALIEECDHLIHCALDRVLGCVKKPVLLLSGGVDSRVILGAMLAKRRPVVAAGYGIADGDDFEVAKKVAVACNLEFIEYPIPMDQPTAYFQRAVRDSDCRAETIDTPSLGLLHVELARRFDGYINGDECFGWRHLVSSDDEAFEAVGLFSLRQLNRLEDWLRAAKRRVCGRHIDETKRALRSIAETGDVNCFKDWLYRQVRTGNMLNGFSGAKLRYYEQARPLLDEDLIEFIARLPNDLRADKRLLRRVLAVKYPHLHDLGLARKDSLPTAETWRQRLRSDGELRNFIGDQLIRGLDARLSSMLDEVRFKRFVEAVTTDSAYPATNTSWWSGLPGMWRLTARLTENRVHPITLMMRVLQLQLYLGESADVGQTFEEGR